MVKIKKIYIFILITCILTFLVYYFSGKKERSNNEVVITLKEYILGSFLNELPEINNRLPHKIDHQTTLISIKYENNKILSIYELSTVFIGGEFLAKIKPSIKKQACGDEMKKKLLEVDVVFLDRYQNSSGDVLFDVPLSKSECAEF
jgi:hypothetical protein